MTVAIDAHVIAVGLDLTRMCDLPVASKKVRSAENFINLGKGGTV